MPATRNGFKASATTRKITSRRGKRSPGNDGDHELETQVVTLRGEAAWEALVGLLDGHDKIEKDALKASYCRALYHIDSPSRLSAERGEQYSDELLAANVGHIDALLCRGALARLHGDGSLASDCALAAFKASGYKDGDALELLQASRNVGSQKVATPAQDHYAALCVTRTAPLAVIRAAHAALSHPGGSAEAVAADAAVTVLSDGNLRAEYDSHLSRTKTGGFGREFQGGSELLKQLGEALGLVFPSGFEFPPSGRFQGGFGGGFEFSWGNTETDTSVKHDDQTMTGLNGG